MIKKTTILCLVILTLSLSMVGTASADINSLTLDSKAALAPNKTSVVATGTVICTADTVDVSVIVSQSSGRVDATGIGSADDIPCTGTVQSFTVLVEVISGTGFKHGPATAIVQAFDSFEDGSDGSALITAGVKL